MKITIDIPEYIVEEVQDQVWETLGRQVSKESLKKFFISDIINLYFEGFADNLADSVDSFYFE